MDIIYLPTGILHQSSVGVVAGDGFTARCLPRRDLPVLLALCSALPGSSLKGSLIAVAEQNLGGTVEPLYNAVREAVVLAKADRAWGEQPTVGELRWWCRGHGSSGRSCRARRWAKYCAACCKGWIVSLGYPPP